VLPRTDDGVSVYDTYTELIETALPSLLTIDTPDLARTFVTQLTRHLHQTSAKNREFYAGEFFNRFKDAAVNLCRAEIEECRQVVRDVHAQADVLNAALQARLTAATATNDREAEHAVWRDRELLQAEAQAKIDQATRRTELVDFRLDAVERLASAIGAELEMNTAPPASD
jgi:hypothetical protein